MHELFADGREPELSNEIVSAILCAVAAVVALAPRKRRIFELDAHALLGLRGPSSGPLSRQLCLLIAYSTLSEPLHPRDIHRCLELAVGRPATGYFPSTELDRRALLSVVLESTLDSDAVSSKVIDGVICAYSSPWRDSVSLTMLNLCALAAVLKLKWQCYLLPEIKRAIDKTPAPSEILQNLGILDSIAVDPDAQHLLARFLPELLFRHQRQRKRDRRMDHPQAKRL
eukprot:CAMPEP_0198319352 /NCGR_PEP_ID=MMETSP1450-20131203/8505_1 /TAXON_ID=753684 ORGANISM="Madagascaria erythrocladiodes, Strain CCMP3234" /NCGR_SAMPLE_ID=MMETSP1450 /ASSEMBLY_ACC=CAM_ASM_001115 /LENGTH=227 /DNA_ID=CAMNT_0044022721 /DNA_START=270 /DNA_END=950 /DNA_ORIENTATION=-